MPPISRTAVSLQLLPELLKREVRFSDYLALTTLPRGDLQIALTSLSVRTPGRLYGQGFHREDHLTWSAILQNKATQPADVWPAGALLATEYWREVMMPNEVHHVVVLPLLGPVLPGYPGAIHLFRKSAEGAFSVSEVFKARAVIRDFEAQLAASRIPRKRSACAPLGTARGASAAESLLVLNAALRPVLCAGDWSEVDARVRDQMSEQAMRRMHQLNETQRLADRVQFPDAFGNVLIFRVITHKHFPALGEGAMSFFCPQPTCAAWAQIDAGDFQADSELSRLIPSLAFMQEQFRAGPPLGEIARTAHLSPFHFHRRFTELLGLTPKQFMLECQIQEAKTQLIAGDTELSQIAKACGFAHQSHFTSRFKQITGLTPTRWRRMMAQRQPALAN